MDPIVNKDKAYHILLMFISPLWGLLELFKSKNEKYITYVTTILFGILGSMYIYNKGNDGTSHRDAVIQHYVDMPFTRFIEDLFKLLTFQPTDYSKDLYKHIISYISGAIFQTPELIHVFGGLLLGYFFSKSVLLVLEDRPKQKMGFLLLGFIILFFTVRTVSAMNSLRMWTGMWVFFYGAYAYVKKGNKKYLWFVGLAILIHFSYLLFSIPLIAAIFLRKRKLIVVGIFIASFFVNFGFNQVTSLIEKTGIYQSNVKGNIISQEVMERRAKEAAITGKGEGSNFYKKYGPSIYNTYSIPLLSVILIIIYLRKSNADYLDFLIAGGLLLVTLSNSVEAISPSVHGRSLTIAATFLTAAAIQILILNKNQMSSKLRSNLIKFSFNIFLGSAFLHFVFHVSFILNTFSMFSIFFPFFSWILGDSDPSLRDFIAFIIL